MAAYRSLCKTVERCLWLTHPKQPIVAAFACGLLEHGDAKFARAEFCISGIKRELSKNLFLLFERRIAIKAKRENRRMLITKTLARNSLLNSSILTGRARIAATPNRQAFYISHSATQRNAFNMATAGEAPKDTKEPCPVKDELPKLSDHEFRMYNRLADKMNWFVS